MMMVTSDVLLQVPSAVAAALERAASGVANARVARTDWGLIRDEVSARAGEVFYEFVSAIANRVASPPGFVVIRGLTFDNFNFLLVAITSSLGHIVDLNVMLPRKDYQGIVNDEGEMFLHTDGSRWLSPNRFTCQQFVTVAPDGGGQSRVIALSHLLDALRGTRRSGLLEFLASVALPWGLDQANGGELLWSPIVEADRIRWSPFAIGYYDGRPLDIDVNVRLRIEEFHKFVQTCRQVTKMSLMPNDLLVIDNHRCLHGRGPLRNRSRSVRRLLRVRIADMPGIERAGDRP